MSAPSSACARVLARLGAVRRDGEGWKAQCPAHEDVNPSLSVGTNERGDCLLYCHAGCELDAILSALDLKLSDLFPESTGSSNRKRTIVATYQYCDEFGTVLFETVRYSPKGFAQRQPDGNGGHVWNLKGVPRVLFNLSRVKAAVADGSPIWIVEGEKDAERLTVEGVIATTSPMGAGKWRKDYADMLAGAIEVIIVRDKDDTGEAHADAIAASLRGKVGKVRLVEARAGKDAFDHLEAGHGVDDFVDVGSRATSSENGREPSDDVPDPEFDPAEKERIADLLRQFGELDDKDKKDALKFFNKVVGRNSIATQLVQLVVEADVELWHDPDGTPYATLSVDGHDEHWPIKSKVFKRWLSRLSYLKHEKAPGSQAVNDALNVIEGKAVFEGDEHDVHVRVAEFAGAVYVDLGDESWQAIEIRDDGWNVRQHAPVRFKRKKGMQALPVPVAGADLKELREFVNVTDDDWPLTVGFAVEVFNPKGPYPVLEIHAEHGHAKTTLMRVLRRLIDPNAADARRPPRDSGRDLAISAANSWVLAFDNLGSLWPALSDDLARIATGSGFATRELYENDEETILNSCRPVILNGIDDIITRPDLLDRAIVVRPPELPDDQRLSEAEFWAKFDAKHAQLLGACCTAVSAALARRDSVQVSPLPRMADFVLWVVAAEPALPIEPGEFLKAYVANRKAARAGAIDADLVAQAVLAFVGKAKDGEWSGTATQLLAALPVPDPWPKGWPKNGAAMAGALRRAAPVLREHGLTVEYDESERHRSPWTLRVDTCEKRTGESD
jgi:hypothetical protein